MTRRHVAGRAIDVSNPDKVMFPDGTTKGDVVDYYERVADLMLPHIGGRPLVLQRFPDGIDEEGFFQKNTPEHVPDWIRRCPLETADGGVTTYSVIDDAAGLVYLADQAALVVHTLLARADAPRRPVEVIFDLDPPADDPQEIDLAPVRHAASALRTGLDELGLAPRVKSTGSRGLHVTVDVLDDDADFGLTRRFARKLATRIARHGPFTLEQRKDRRQGRLFLDVLRNAPANHAVAPWSLRPLDGAPVAVPLGWDEALDADFHPRRITIANVFRRLGQKDDPWADAPRPTSTIAAAIAALDGSG